MSLPARGVWIEITSHQSWYNAVGSLPARGVWIEIFGPFGRAIALAASLLARGVWIEITKQALDSLGTSVTPRKGSVN